MDFNKETPTATFVIQGQNFQIPKPFAEGHACSASDASVLNQILAENTRNNWSTRVQAAIKDATDEAPFDHDKMQADIDEYLEGYEFGVRRGRGPVDPVEREALSIAKELVKAALRKAGHKIASVDVSEINRLAEEAVEKNEKITTTAKRRVEERTALGADSLDVSSVAA